MTFKQAIDLAERSFTDLVFSGYAYRYLGNYIVELKNKASSNSAGVTDGLFLVDTTSKKVKPYSPLIDGFHDLSKIEIYTPNK